MVAPQAVDAPTIVLPGLAQSSESGSRCMCRDEFQSKVDDVTKTCDMRNTSREEFEKCQVDINHRTFAEMSRLDAECKSRRRFDRYVVLVALFVIWVMILLR